MEIIYQGGLISQVNKLKWMTGSALPSSQECLQLKLPLARRAYMCAFKTVEKQELCCKQIISSHSKLCLEADFHAEHRSNKQEGRAKVGVANGGEPWLHPLTCVRATYKGTIKDEMFPAATQLPPTSQDLFGWILRRGSQGPISCVVCRLATYCQECVLIAAENRDEGPNNGR